MLNIAISGFGGRLFSLFDEIFKKLTLDEFNEKVSLVAIHEPNFKLCLEDFYYPQITSSLSEKK